MNNILIYINEQQSNTNPKYNINENRELYRL